MLHYWGNSSANQLEMTATDMEKGKGGTNYFLLLLCPAHEILGDENKFKKRDQAPRWSRRQNYPRFHNYPRFYVMELNIGLLNILNSS